MHAEVHRGTYVPVYASLHTRVVVNEGIIDNTQNFLSLWTCVFYMFSTAAVLSHHLSGLGREEPKTLF